MTVSEEYLHACPSLFGQSMNTDHEEDFTCPFTLYQNVQDSLIRTELYPCSHHLLLGGMLFVQSKDTTAIYGIEQQVKLSSTRTWPVSVPLHLSHWTNSIRNNNENYYNSLMLLESLGR